jgi:hypothetical protein
MNSASPWHRQRPWRLYLLGHVMIVLGAALMDATGSMLPMALGASAALMLQMPLIKAMARRFLRR